MMSNLDKIKEAEKKILMLYILSKAKKDVATKVYLELVTTLTDINYFDFYQLIKELIQENFVEKKVKSEMEFYHLTEYGKQTLDLTITMVPGINKLKIDSEFRKYFKEIRQERAVSARYLPHLEKVECKVIEDDNEVLKIELHVRSSEEAKNIVRHWNENPDKLYLEIYNLLLGSKKVDELEKENMMLQEYKETPIYKEDK